MDTDLVSIIVPVYNAERFLEKCVDSILNQSYTNIEVILIDDGSTDNSGNICDLYSQKDKRVKVIHQINSGPSIARNKGIHNASGTFIQFVDSDDYIEPNMIETLVDKINRDVDIVICGYKYIYKENDNIVVRNSNTYKESKISKDEFLDKFGKLFKDYYINYICNKLYITDIIKNNNIYFDSSIGWGEDLIFNLTYLNHCENIFIIEDLLYNYVKYNENSITSTFNRDLYNNQKSMYNKVRKFLIENNSYSGENERIVESKYTNSVIMCLSHLFRPDSSYDKIKLKSKINEIIEDDMVRERINYFNYGGIQKKIIGKAIKNKSTNFIICFFRIKNFMRDNMKYLFNILRKMNNCKN